MATSDNGLYALIVAPLLATIVGLAKRLYDAPRQSELDRIVKDCDELRDERDSLRALVDRAADEARALSAARDTENRKLREEVAALRSTVTRRTETGGPDGSPTRSRVRRRPRRDP